MKKIIFSLILISFLVSWSFVLAQDQDLPSSGTTPDSPLYFLKEWKEKIQLFLTLNAENKAKQYLHLAEVRLAEYQKMIDKGKTEIAQKTLEKYEKQLDRALAKVEEMKQKGKDVKDISQKLEDNIIKHTGILEKNLQKVPEAGKKGIEKALDESNKALEKIKGRRDETSKWKTYRNEEQGFEFKYPEKLDTNYISVVSEGWPPKMTIAATNSNLICDENPNIKTEIGYGSLEKLTIGNNTYCLTEASGAAAGTRFVTYEYLTARNSKLITLIFVLGYPTCSNIAEDNEMKKCEKEQRTFSPNALADKIISTLKFLKPQTNLIEVFTPKPNKVIKSPLSIEGKARGTWFFEGSFPIRLLDGNGKEIAAVLAQPQGEWMTEDFVNFKATLEFVKPETEKGTLVFEKDNPSGLPQNAEELRIPVIFGTAKNDPSKPITASLGEQFTLKKKQFAKIAGTGLEIGVAEFYNSPCPAGVQCVWSGVGIGFEYRFNGQVQKGTNLVRAFGFQTNIIKTDHETYANLVVEKIK